MKTNGNHPANPTEVTLVDGEICGAQTGESKGINIGLTKREMFAMNSTNDFDELHSDVRFLIVGEYSPGVNSPNYLKYLTKGRAIWKVMQADALIEALNKEE